MLIAFFKISRLPLQILHLLVQLPNRLSHLVRTLLLPINLPRLLSLQIRLLPSMQTRFAASKLVRYLHHTLAAVDHKLHCLAFVLLRIHWVLSLFCFHRVLFLSLSSRVRQIGGGSIAANWIEAYKKYVSPNPPTGSTSVSRR